MFNKITIYQRENTRGEKTNPKGFTTECLIERGDVEALAQAVQYDNCPAQYKDGYKKGENFIKADCILADIDNTHSNESTEWITHEDVIRALPNVEFYYYPSRNHMKQKGTDAPRPKAHYIFPIDVLTSVEEYTNIMKWLIETFPQLHFDKAVKGGAQLNFGVENPNVQYHQGTQNLSEYMKTAKLQTSCTVKQSTTTDVIPQGQRHNYMLSYACRILKRHGDDENTYVDYQRESSKCSPLLEEKELNSIWCSAKEYYHTQIRIAPDYVDPSQYGKNEYHRTTYKPSNFTDVGQAKVFSELYKYKVGYSEATKFLVYNGKMWEENNLKAQKHAQDLTDFQLDEAWEMLKKANQMENSAMVSGNKEDEEKAKKSIENAKQYRKFALSRQDTLSISATLREARPMLEIDTAILDKDWYKLNTPNGTVDLRTGELHPHNSADYCTKITTKSPITDEKEKVLFTDFLDVITCSDKELENYLQCVAGMIALGKVFCEHMIIAYGCGSNGKSTFFNLLSKVLGSYSGSLSSEVLTANCRKNKSPEYAELRGKRLVIAAELEDDMRLDTAIVKKLCSTDPIQAEKKYKDPFHYTPSHTLVLYTNHLPRVTALDDGTWRRLVVIPFNARIQGKQDKKNYMEYLFEKAGGYVMQWIIEGACKFIANDFKLKLPKVVEAEIKRYRSDNDWISNFISECCEIVSGYQQPRGALYKGYQAYCKDNGEEVRSNIVFKNAMIEKGFKDGRTNSMRYFEGIRLRSTICDFEMPTVTIPTDLVQSVSSDTLVTESDSDLQDSQEVNF